MDMSENLFCMLVVYDLTFQTFTVGDYDIVSILLLLIKVYFCNINKSICPTTNDQICTLLFAKFNIGCDVIRKLTTGF